MNNLNFSYIFFNDGDVLFNCLKAFLVIIYIVYFLLNVMDSIYKLHFDIYEIYYNLEQILYSTGNALNFLHTKFFFFFVMFFPLMVILFYTFIFMFTKFFSNYFLNIFYSRSLFVTFGYVYFFLFMLLVEDFMFFSEVYKNNELFINNF